PIKEEKKDLEIVKQMPTNNDQNQNKPILDVNPPTVNTNINVPSSLHKTHKLQPLKPINNNTKIIINDQPLKYENIRSNEVIDKPKIIEQPKIIPQKKEEPLKIDIETKKEIIVEETKKEETKKEEHKIPIQNNIMKDSLFDDLLGDDLNDEVQWGVVGMNSKEKTIENNPTLLKEKEQNTLNCFFNQPTSTITSSDNPSNNFTKNEDLSKKKEIVDYNIKPKDFNYKGNDIIDSNISSNQQQILQNEEDEELNKNITEIQKDKIEKLQEFREKVVLMKKEKRQERENQEKLSEEEPGKQEQKRSLASKLKNLKKNN
ncbi:MAG: hypothetical protein ACRC42_02925, partial [Mycoplasma sp.]